MDWEKEKQFYNALNIATESNFKLIRTLKSFFKTYEKIWQSDDYSQVQKNSQHKSETFDKLKQNKIQINPEKEYQKLEQNETNLILLEQELYPHCLKEIFNPPLGLYIRGELENQKPTIAIVGTRKTTQYGRMVAEKFSRELSQVGFEIISGLALGIDSISHEVSLKNNNSTIAVLGSGLNQIFPKENICLAQKICENGCLISEYPLETKADRHQFPARNRIVSGLSLGVLVIEAPIKSGALITARMALEQNREVFAIPGQINSFNAQGCNELIKSGAKLVNSVDDVLEELTHQYCIGESTSHCHPREGGGPCLFPKLIPKVMDPRSRPSLTLGAVGNDRKYDDSEEQIFELIKNSPSGIEVDKIIEKSKLTSSQINSILTFLELRGLVVNDNGMCFLKI